MGQQSNKVQKRKRRSLYLKRKKAVAKLKAKPAAKPAAKATAKAGSKAA